VRQAIADDIPASERSSRHLDAARLLYADGTPSERVAAHLLLGRAEGDPWVIEQLRAAAREAGARGAAPSAVSYLKRALEEPANGDAKTELLAELGEVGARIGMPDAADYLAQAAERTRDPMRRAELALRRGQALYAQGHHQQAAVAYDGGLAELEQTHGNCGSVELHDSLATGFVASALLIPALHAAAAERSAQLLARVESDPAGPVTRGQRQLLAQASVRGAWAGEPARTVVELAERAWSNGRLLEDETSDGISWSLVAAALALGGDLERAVAVADAALRDATARSSPLAFANANYARSIPCLWRGSVNDAIADLELARDARRYGWRQFARAAAAFHALGLIERRDLDGAERTLLEEGELGTPDDLEEVLRLAARAELRLAQGRSHEALSDALAAGRGLATLPGSKFVPWRAVAAQSALAAGETQQAIALAHENLEVAQRVGVPHGLIRAHRVIGLVEARGRGLQSLRAAVELGDSLPPRLETIRALVDLGSALRRDNQRAAAREPLQRAVDLAWAGGALALHERARTELAASGARPRRDALLSGPASLTPSERRIAELAASGQSNREIAQTLFVTPKTVEYHLRNAYRKLGIERRGDLGGVLAARATP
jgi:DNA-binding CsgD family transcriptional regulator